MNRSNISFWEQQSFFQYDILIIGSGIVGLTAAIALKEQKPHWDIAILERGFLPSGASTKNAGFACFGSISELIEQEKICGTNGLQQLVARRWKGLLKLRSLLGDHKIDFHCKGGYELFTAQENQLATNCLSKIDYFNQLLFPITGEKNTFRPAPSKIKAFGFKGVNALIENGLEAQLDTGKMMKGLLQKAAAAGVLLLNGCTVSAIEERKDSVRLHTNQGHFGCRRLLVATNGFATELIPELPLKPGRGQVLVTHPLPGLKVNGTFHYQKGYYYFRNVGNRLLLGGGRHLDPETETTTEPGLTDKIQHALKRLLQEIILPELPFEIAQRWSGIMAFGPELPPVIRQIGAHTFCAVRGSGMGIAIGSQTGFDAAGLILNQEKGQR